jgi:hypothetical protein
MKKLLYLLIPKGQPASYYQGYAVAYKLAFWLLWITVFTLYVSGYLRFS